MLLRAFHFPATCIGMSLSVLLMSCSSSPPEMSVPSEPTAQANPLSQTLPITAQATIGGKTIQLEVARTPEQQQIGLMNRKTLADDRGMLFLFSPARPTQFWMKNTLIPLDMVFLRNGTVRVLVPNVPPCKVDPCPTYGSQTEEIDQVIELRGGRATELGVKVGDRIPVQFLNDRKP